MPTVLAHTRVMTNPGMAEQPDSEMAEMRIVKTRRGFAVSGGQPYYLFGPGTKRAAQEYIDQCERTRADLAAFEAAKEARIAEILAARGISPIDFRRLRRGDSYATSPGGPLRAVTRVQHFDSGASLACYDASRAELANHAPGCTVLTPAFPVYGVLRHEAED